MKTDKQSYYNIETLAQITGLTRRAIRYYVQRELLPKPEGGGRGHYYTDEHLKRIETIQKWQTQGVPLEKIKELLARGEMIVEEKVSEPEASRAGYPIPHVSTTKWTRVSIGEDIDFSFRYGALTEQDQKEIEDFIISKIKK
jgi:DNA-binding transcriptional MerR regulator